MFRRLRRSARPRQHVSVPEGATLHALLMQHPQGLFSAVGSYSWLSQPCAGGSNSTDRDGCLVGAAFPRCRMPTVGAAHGILNRRWHGLVESIRLPLDEAASRDASDEGRMGFLSITVLSVLLFSEVAVESL